MKVDTSTADKVEEMLIRAGPSRPIVPTSVPNEPILEGFSFDRRRLHPSAKTDESYLP